MLKKRIVIISSILLLLGMLLIICNYDNKTYDKFTITDKLKNNQSIQILVVGDSIGGSTNPDDWCMLVKSELDEILTSKIYLDNISVPGWKSFAGMINLNNYRHENANIKSVDLIILCFGQNDVENNTFPIYYESLIRACKKNYPFAAIAAVLENSIQKESSKRKEIITLCDYYNIPYADMLQAYEESGKEYEDLTEDWIHPNAEGKIIYANEIIELIKDNFIEPEFKPTVVEEPLYSESKKYEKTVYIGLKDLNIKGNTLCVDLEGKTYGGFGIDILLTDHTVSFNINDLKDYEIPWEESYQARRIIDVDSDIQIDNKLTIEFNEVEDINRVTGIILY